MTEQSTPLKALESASQLHESETVIELGADRFLQFISVRLVIILAIVAKITEILNGNLSCHLVHNETGSNMHFVKFANVYCWESPVVRENSESSTKKKCEIEDEVDGKKLLKHPEAAMNVLRWMPYGLLFEAFLFPLPSAWWHFRVGGRLMGHLKFIQLLIARICDELKDLPAGIWIDQPYDSQSAHLDGWCSASKGTLPTKSIKTTIKKKDERPAKYFKQTMGIVRGDELNKYVTESKEKAAGVSEMELPAREDYSDIFVPPNDLDGKKQTKNKGKMLDRHLFSNLSYENFASLENFPYLLSIIRLTYCVKFDDEEGIFPLNQGILRQWCHEKNFSGRFLVRNYYLKHALGILISLAMLRTTAFIFELVGGDIWTSDSFRCEVIYYEEKFIVCTLHRKTEMLAFLLLNLLIILAHLTTTIWQICFISTSRNREASSFFENVNDTGSVALLAALRERQKKEDKNKKK